MTHDPTLEGQVQGVLNELLDEKLIPFALNVGKITKGPDKYTVHFYDNRIRTAEVPMAQDQLLRDTIRSSVLARVARICPFGPGDTKERSLV